jgi:hypothetical protein
LSRAFISWATLATTDKLFQTFGRLATIWFDDMILQLPAGSMLENVFDDLVARGEMKSESAEYLLRCWKPIQQVLPEYTFLGLIDNHAGSQSKSDFDNPWAHPNKSLVELAGKIVKDATKADYPEADEQDPGFQHEVAWAGAGLIHAIDSWLHLDSIEPTSIITSEREDALIAERLQAQQPVEGFNAFLSTMESKLPNFSDLSWERAIELREHQYLSSFRSKLRAVQQAVKTQSASDVASMITDLEGHDLKEIARLTKPSMKSTVVKAVLGNIPLPIPLNPVSVYSSSTEIANARKMTRQFGWLYFLLDVEQP